MNYNIDNLLKEFPNVAVQEVGGRLYGTFIIGNQYKRANGFHGEYPPSFLNRIYALFPDARNQFENILHLFSGSIEGDDPDVATFDINPMLGPLICGNAEELSKHVDKWKYELIIADPPYAEKDCEIYGCKMPNKRVVIKECRKVIEPEGWLVWLDLITPIWSKQEWELRGLIQLWCGSNRKVRTVSLFQAV